MEEITLKALLAKIKSDDADVRTEGWLAAGSVGAAAVKPLAKLVATGDLEVGRAAKRALWKIVRTVGAPGAKGKAGVVAALLGLLPAEQPSSVRREALWMLSEIGGEETLDVLCELPGILEDKEIREDARCCVQRIPCEAAVDALKKALEEAPDDFKPAIAQSLRARGVEVDPKKYPCVKMVPTKETAVKPVGR